MIIKFTGAARENLTKRLNAVLKYPEHYDMDALIYEILIRVSDRVPGSNEPGYEIGEGFSNTGEPCLLSFNDSDFVTEE